MSLLSVIGRTPHYNPRIKQNRKKLDVNHFKTFGYWRRKKRPRVFSCLELQIRYSSTADDGYWYQFCYQSFPKDILFELGKNSRIGFRLSNVSLVRILFLTRRQFDKLDPNMVRIRDNREMSLKEWRTFKRVHCFERIELVV